MKTGTELWVVAVFWLAAALACAGAHVTSSRQRELRVCADPNNLPFSNRSGDGFENKLAELIAGELHARVEYTWWAQRRGYVRNTVGSGRCDVLMGVPSRFERTLVTRPYYQSSYVFVTRQHDGPHVRSLDDDVLRHVRVGVQLIGDDGENSPPAHALAARQIVENVVGYTVYGDYLEPNPPAKIVDAVARREIDVAIVWGPLAGYFAPLQSTPLEVTPVTPQVDRILPFTFDISVGVARRARALRDEIDKVLDRRRADIDRLLAEYRVPRVDHAN